eukprot:Rmarinus@m.22526
MSEAHPRPFWSRAIWGAPTEEHKHTTSRGEKARSKYLDHFKPSSTSPKKRDVASDVASRPVKVSSVTNTRLSKAANGKTSLAYSEQGSERTAIKENKEKRAPSARHAQEDKDGNKDKKKKKEKQVYPSDLLRLEERLRRKLKDTLDKPARSILLNVFRLQSYQDDTTPFFISVSGFLRILERFNIASTPLEVKALFRKYGHDEQGLMPFDVFISGLLASKPEKTSYGNPRQAFPLSFPEQEYSWGPLYLPPHGRIAYPPTDWNISDVSKTRTRPAAVMDLEFVHGHDAILRPSWTLFCAIGTDIIYSVAKLVVLHDTSVHEQRFVSFSANPVTCIAAHPSRKYFATAHGGDDGRVYVWDAYSLRLLSKFACVAPDDFATRRGDKRRNVYQMTFLSSDSEDSRADDRLLTVCDDAHATALVWENVLSAPDATQRKRDGPRVAGVVRLIQNTARPRGIFMIPPPAKKNKKRFQNQNEETLLQKIGERGRVMRASQRPLPAARPAFCTFGPRHMTTWFRNDGTRTRDPGKEFLYVGQGCRLGGYELDDFQTACFIPTASDAICVIGGGAKGGLYVFESGECIALFKGHEGPVLCLDSFVTTPTMLSMAEGSSSRIRNPEDEAHKTGAATVVSGGADGRVRVWHLCFADLIMRPLFEFCTPGVPFRPPKVQTFDGAAPAPTPQELMPAVRGRGPPVCALDFHPSLRKLVIGTLDGEIWEVLPEPFANAVADAGNAVLGTKDSGIEDLLNTFLLSTKKSTLMRSRLRKRQRRRDPTDLGKWDDCRLLVSSPGPKMKGICTHPVLPGCFASYGHSGLSIFRQDRGGCVRRIEVGPLVGADVAPTQGWKKAKALSVAVTAMGGGSEGGVGSRLSLLSDNPNSLQICVTSASFSPSGDLLAIGFMFGDTVILRHAVPPINSSNPAPPTVVAYVGPTGPVSPDVLDFSYTPFAAEIVCLSFSPDSTYLAVAVGSEVSKKRLAREDDVESESDDPRTAGAHETDKEEDEEEGSQDLQAVANRVLKKKAADAEAARKQRQVEERQRLNKARAGRNTAKVSGTLGVADSSSDDDETSENAWANQAKKDGKDGGEAGKGSGSCPWKRRPKKVPAFAVYVFDVLTGYDLKAVCVGHTSAVRVIDWSCDSLLMRTQTEKEVMHFDAESGRAIHHPLLRDVWWYSEQNTSSFRSMGTWPPAWNAKNMREKCGCTAVSSVDHSKCERFQVVGCDNGDLKIFHSPAVFTHSPHNTYRVHQGPILSARLSSDDSRVLAASVFSPSLFQWRTLHMQADQAHELRAIRVEHAPSCGPLVAKMERHALGVSVTERPKRKLVEETSSVSSDVDEMAELLRKRRASRSAKADDYQALHSGSGSESSAVLSYGSSSSVSDWKKPWRTQLGRVKKESKEMERARLHPKTRHDKIRVSRKCLFDGRRHRKIRWVVQSLYYSSASTKDFSSGGEDSLGYSDDGLGGTATRQGPGEPAQGGSSDEFG